MSSNSNSVKCRRISRSEFRRLVAAERRVARSHGFSLKIYYRPINWRYVSEHGRFAQVSGEFCSDEKAIRVSVMGRPGRGRILSVLYHEMRHLEHFVGGLFADYYRLTPFTTKEIFSKKDPCVPSGFKMPDLKVALKAERDCNTIARRKLKKLNINVTVRQYHHKETLAYRVATQVTFILIRKKREISEASPLRAKFLQYQIDKIHSCLKEGGYMTDITEK